MKMAVFKYCYYVTLLSQSFLTFVQILISYLLSHKTHVGPLLKWDAHLKHIILNPAFSVQVKTPYYCSQRVIYFLKLNNNTKYAQLNDTYDPQQIYVKNQSIFTQSENKTLC
jgi:hypothetical protein